MNDQDLDVPSSEDRPSCIVGIGASAGGLEAIERFFDHLPKDTGMAFVLVQHLSPDFKSLMDELLARHTQLPIRHVEDGMLVQANHVYLIPPKKEMIISGGRLLLSEREQKQELSLPIDVFFRSLAQDCGARAVAIVLSGGGSDGSRGVKAVHDAGGLVLVQTPESAQFDGMPKASRDSGIVDAFLLPEDMPQRLQLHARGETEKEASTIVEDSRLGAVYKMLQDEFGIDFNHYKPSTVTRRIERRLRLARADDLNEYIGTLKREKTELDVLYRDLLIGVTRFFRNEEAFAALEQRVLPELLQTLAPGKPFRVWVAGCATGEEVYSLAILLHELTTKLGPRPIKIFATDVHRGSLDVAAAAIYGEEAVERVKPALLEKYFSRRGRSYQVVPDIRQLVVFAPHNVIKDPPFTRVDLVSCRNLLIYLTPAAQQKALSLFHFALNRGGVVFLGPSESPGLLSHDFATIDRTWRIYRKYSDVRMPVDTRLMPVRTPQIAATTPAVRFPLSQLIGTYDALLDELMPPSLLVTAHGELVHAFAGASKLLKLQDGRQGLDLLDVVEGDLRMVLAGGIQRALRDHSTIVFRGVRAGGGDDGALYKISIRRVRGRAASQHVLIQFEPMDSDVAPPAKQETEIDIGSATREKLGVLEAELAYTKENLQAAIEELETSNEELQAANEELLASNEELQSTNEELQSVNEELYTVNAEYQRKIGELTELTNDMDNLLSSTEIGTIFLDKQLKIRKFTPKIAEIFDLLPHDVGRPITAFTHSIDHPDLARDLSRVLDKGDRIEVEVTAGGKSSYFLRILPYRARGAIQGITLTLVDVSALKAAEDALFHERYLLDSLLSSVPDAIYFKDARGRFIRANVPMAIRLGVHDPAEVAGKTPLELPAQDVAAALHRQDEAILASGNAQHYNLEKIEAPGTSDMWTLATRLPLVDRRGATVGVIGVLRDVTDQKRAEDKIQEAVRRRDQFLAMLSHELRNPLGAIVAATSLLKPARAEIPGKVVDVIERQSQQMARLLDDLLEASRVTQNKIELKRRQVDLRSVIREAVDAIRPAMAASGIELTVDVGAEPLELEGDPARLQQVFANLLHNAAKYTPRGGHAWVRVGREGDRAVARVKDDGVGIPKSMLDAIFDLFVQSNRTLDRAQGGIGVGLTLVRSLIEMHGGCVRAESEGEGSGSQFVVELPITPNARETHGDPVPMRSIALPANARIVVIEDNIDARDMLCEVLRLAGFECHTAGDGVGGLALIETVRPHAAIVDLGLPGIDGLELARRVRADAKHAGTFLIALTGYGQHSDRLAARRAGFDEHMVKPADPGALLRLLSGDAQERKHAERTFTGGRVS